MPELTDPAAQLAGVLAKLSDVADLMAAEALGPSELARVLSVSDRTVHNLNEQGMLPAPAYLGTGERMPRWSRREIVKWVEAGCPSRIQWQALREQALRRSA